MTQQIDRQELRQGTLARRDLLSREERSGKSRKIAENFWQLPETEEARCIFIYVHFRSEVETLELIHQCLARNMTVAVPYTDVAAKRLHPFRITQPEKELQPGYCAIPEPDIHRAARVAPEIIDIAVIPGSVFDVKGGRLGYGGGYYDRFLVNDAPRAKRIGLAFEMQVVERVPMQPHDQHLDILVTEERIVNTRA